MPYRNINYLAYETYSLPIPVINIYSFPPIHFSIDVMIKKMP